jgi:hypothetical protein
LTPRRPKPEKPFWKTGPGATIIAALIAALALIVTRATNQPAVAPQDPDQGAEHRELREGQGYTDEKIDKLKKEMRERFERLEREHPNEADPGRLTKEYGPSWQIAYLESSGTVLGVTGELSPASQIVARVERQWDGSLGLEIKNATINQGMTFGGHLRDVFVLLDERPGACTPIPGAPLAVCVLASSEEGALVALVGTQVTRG